MRNNRKIFFSIVIFLISLYTYSCGGGGDSKKEDTRKKVDIKNSYESRFIYDEQDRLKYEHYKRTSNSKIIEYKYDNNGNILEVNIN